ncbi:MAG: class II aldolase/adducin family protein [Rubrivivax sp.]|mgnify:CR=1 FL=1|jgi:ribulose-5-phosphate 4-epimerase/fuculose-1-phosphate aldolase|nr:class II aldolase/adducin family protein [Rubrivivax sp.]MBK8528818.1 class II aldolase/adducin family protein [Rubrivivax sp.]
MARPANCSDAEWQTRLDLAACYRVFHLLGWTEMIYNHISLRVPGPECHFLINPFGLHYSEVKASNLLKIDLQGQLLCDSPYKINAAGFHPHAALHGGIADAHCVMHTHTTAGMAVASSQAGLQITNFYAAQLGGRVAYHDFEGITVHAEEGTRMVQAIGDKPAVILRNHGLLAWGSRLPGTFYTLWILQRACEIQLAGAALGPAIEITRKVQIKCQADARRVNTDPDFARENFDAMVRLVDRQNPDWRE